MTLYDDICTFLAGKGLEHTAGDTCGHGVIQVGDFPCIIPVTICSKDISQAENESEALKEAIGHIMKTSGKYPLIITEDRWRLHSRMMRHRLLAHLNIFTPIYARNCEVRKIDKQTASAFLSANHSYGDAACRYRYGLFLKRHTGHNSGSVDIVPGTLVAVATFSNARKWIKGDKVIRSYEWTRYASLPEVRLSGGMGKLLTAFIEDVKPDDIMTYADLEWSEGKVYEALGFKLEGHKEAVRFVIDNNWKRTAYQEHGEVMYFQNLGSNKYRLKLTDYQ